MGRRVFAVLVGQEPFSTHFVTSNATELMFKFESARVGGVSVPASSTAPASLSNT